MGWLSRVWSSGRSSFSSNSFLGKKQSQWLTYYVSCFALDNIQFTVEEHRMKFPRAYMVQRKLAIWNIAIGRRVMAQFLGSQRRIEGAKFSSNQIERMKLGKKTVYNFSPNWGKEIHLTRSICTCKDICCMFCYWVENFSLTLVPFVST